MRFFEHLNDIARGDVYMTQRPCFWCAVFFASLLAAVLNSCVHAENKTLTSSKPGLWKQSYRAGYTDAGGKYAGGSEIMHIIPHKGKLYAFNGYWTDAHFPKQSAQVLRLDRGDGKWLVDLETNSTGLVHMKGNILKSVTFKTDKNAKKIDATVLIAASQAFGVSKQNHGAVSVFVRNDATGKWTHSLQQPGVLRKIRRVPRDIEVYHDPVTGIDRVFLLVGDPGIVSGVYNSTTKSIEWEPKPEHPADRSTFPARPLGITGANGKLYFSVGGTIFVRTNGARPAWSLAYEISGKVNTDVGGIRGLSTISNPTGPGESLIFVWTPSGACRGDIKRLDGVGLKEANETTLRALFDKEFKEAGAHARFSLGGYNRFFPVKDPRTGKTVHLVGFEQRIITKDESIKWNHYYKGALYSVRSDKNRYSTFEVNGRWAPSKPILVAPRAFANSPFPGEENVIYFGGHDANFNKSTDMAWIFKANIKTVLGYDSTR
jgi:poly(A) polymerase